MSVTTEKKSLCPLGRVAVEVVRADGLVVFRFRGPRNGERGSASMSPGVARDVARWLLEEAGNIEREKRREQVLVEEAQALELFYRLTGTQEEL